MERLEATFTCLLIDSLPVKAERIRYPSLQGRAVVIVANRGDVDVVLDSSGEAEGVSPDMTISEALEVRAAAIIMQADERHYRDTSDRIMDGLEMRFGAVERAGLGCIFVPIKGLSGSPSGEAQLIVALQRAAPPGFGPRVGLGAGRLIAFAAAATAPEGRAKRAPTDSRAFLGTCPVDLLPVAADLKARLHHAGVRTLLDLDGRPPALLQSLFPFGSGEAWEFASVTGLIKPLPATHVAA